LSRALSLFEFTEDVPGPVLRALVGGVDGAHFLRGLNPDIAEDVVVGSSVLDEPSLDFSQVDFVVG